MPLIGAHRGPAATRADGRLRNGAQFNLQHIDCIHCCQGRSVTPFNKVTMSVALSLPVCSDWDIDNGEI